MTGLKLTFLKIYPIVLVLLILAGCTGVGIFAVVAVSEKIDEGRLPEGLSASRVIQINPGIPTSDFFFFSSGPKLWYKNKNDIDGIWQKTRLLSGGTEWDGIQSIVATDNKIIMALYDVNGGNYRVGLHALTAFNAPNATIEPIAGAVWSSTSSTYKTIRLFCPVPAGDIYVNVMDHIGEYGTLDSESITGFTGSSLYTLTNMASDWATRSPEIGAAHLNGGIPGRYVSGVAIGGGFTRITATPLFFSINNGILMDGAGNLVPNPHGNPDGSISIAATEYTNVSTTGITWLPDRGAFITAGVSLYNGTFPVFASSDGTTWYSLPGTSTDYLTTNFVDLTATTAGANIVLAGTSSYIDGSTSYIASGYNEIDVTDLILANWRVFTNWDDYNLALKNNYSVSDLSRATIVGMSTQVDGLLDRYLYASTRFEGLWRLNLEEDDPSWTRE